MLQEILQRMAKNKTKKKNQCNQYCNVIRDPVDLKGKTDHRIESMNLKNFDFSITQSNLIEAVVKHLSAFCLKALLYIVVYQKLGRDLKMRTIYLTYSVNLHRNLYTSAQKRFQRSGFNQCRRLLSHSSTASVLHLSCYFLTL